MGLVPDGPRTTWQGSSQQPDFSVNDDFQASSVFPHQLIAQAPKWLFP
jgi:hypothetical protein